MDHSKVAGTDALQNFPMLVSLVDPELKTVANSDGSDILFTAADGVTKLAHEIVATVTLEQAYARADLIYLAQPILKIIDFFPRLAPHVRPGTLVTDAGSTKSAIVGAASAALPPGTFLGGHPMAGKESRGVAAADAALFVNRPYVLTPSRTGELDRPLSRDFLELVCAIGARPIILETEQHDRLVAFTSHLPQLLSTCLASVLTGVEGCHDVIGPSVIDLTRLALSPYALLCKLA